jgi:hypothetical protein
MQDGGIIVIPKRDAIWIQTTSNMHNR